MASCFDCVQDDVVGLSATDNEDIHGRDIGGRQLKDRSGSAVAHYVDDSLPDTFGDYSNYSSVSGIFIRHKSECLRFSLTWPTACIVTGAARSVNLALPNNKPR